MDDWETEVNEVGRAAGNEDHPHQRLFLRRLASLREKLLDLSNRNRLLSFKHSDRARTHVRVIDELPDVLFARLSDGKQMRFKSLPEPETEPKDESTDEFLMELEAARANDEIYKQEIQALSEDEASSHKAQQIERALRDRVRERLGMVPWVDESELSKDEFARLQGIEPAYELPRPPVTGSDPDRHLDDEIQTLLFPREMDRKLSGIVDQARTMNQEAGVSTLRAAFGFLEWREADQSEITHLSPLLLVPMSIDRKAARPWPRYEISANISEVETNKTLELRLKRNFGYDLPAFEDEDTPESYLAKIERSVEPIQNWRVRRFVTIGNFGFSKLAMYIDLDPKQWSVDGGFAQHGLIRTLLLGENRSDDDPFEAPDYDIDSPDIDARDLLLVTDADASQHSALVDALDGKNLVIMGPPGTGKSQTITNLIAASIASGKKVLFVAEKMAALDVVFSRIRAAGLEDYCLEVHSNKTSKVQVLQSLKMRLELQNRVPPPATFETKLEELRGVRDRLNEYVTALSQGIGSLGLSVQEVLWGERRARDEAGDAWEIIRDADLDGALNLTPAQRNAAQHAIYDAISRIPELTASCGCLQNHAWAWVANHQLTPFDQQEVRAAGMRWSDALKELNRVIGEFRQRFGPIHWTRRDSLARVARTLTSMAEPSEPVVVVMARVLADERLRQAVSDLLRSAAKATEGDSRTMVLSDLPRIASDWADWHKEIDKSLAIVGDLAPEAKCLSEAAQMLPRLRDDCDRLARNLEVARAVSEAAGVTAEISVGFANTALRAASLISEASGELLARREPALFDEGAETILSRAVSSAEDLSAERRSLEQVLVLSPLPSLEEVDRHVRALRAAGALGAISRSVRAAKRFFRSIAAPGVQAGTPEIIGHLTRLAGHLDARAKFAQNSRLAQFCGQWFEGADTRFDLLTEAQQWGLRVRSTVPASDSYGVAVRKLLLRGAPELLRRIAEQSRDIESDGAWLKNLADEQRPVTDHIAETRRRIAALQEVISSFSQKRINHTASLSVVARVAERLRDLNPLRNKIREALPELAERRISLLLVVDGFRLASSLADLGLPVETYARILSGDPRADFRRLSEWSVRVEAALAREAAERTRVIELLQIIEEPFAGADGVEHAEPDTIIRKLDDALSHPMALRPWVDFLRAKKKAADLGLGQLVEALARHETPADHGVAAYNALVYRLLAKAAYEAHPLIREFDGLGIQRARDRFRKLDREIIDLQRAKIRSDLCHARIPAGNAVGLKREFTELALIRNELGKRVRHAPLRDLFDRAAGAIQQMKPCMMMSPLSVATYLKPGSMTFDLIVIDEASQMPPEDAIGALVRADQCVVVGDRQQLPPTSFFRRFEDAIDIEEEEESEDLQIESILDQAHNVFLPPRMLRWHYRSRHQSLIAFSNKHFYENGLTIFPSPVEEDENLGIRLIQVSGQYADRHNPPEARAIAVWALDFMRHRADRSLGVVAVNQLQRDLINDEMQRLFERDRFARSYWDRWEGTLDHFFVKNLENVQGDERDVIAISTVYGPSADGKTRNYFGPISQANGHRRLNVLFTRARDQVVLFSSLKPENIVLGETTPLGTRVLRNYLEYALTKRLDPGKETDRAPESDFEIAVASRLTRLGYEVVPQLGVAGFFIDLAVRHPDFPGTFLIGVECDGATYHSAKSARDRDRLREEVLIGLGWTIYRVWSTDWFHDPARETEKLRLFIERAAADRHTLYPDSPTVELSAIQQGPDEGDTIAAIAGELACGQAHEDGPDVESDRLGPTLPDHLASEDRAAQRRPSEETEERRPDGTIEIGDTVTFHFTDDPDHARTSTIVRGDADLQLGTISAHSPIGEALIGARAGEDVEIYAPKGARTAIVDKIAKGGTSTGLAAPEAETAPPTTDGGRDHRAAAPDATNGGAPRPAPSRPPGASGKLAPYRNWTRTALPDPRETGTAQVASHLREIIEVEGPIRVQRSYQLYARACGINRVGRVVHSELNKALHYLVTQGEVLLEHEGPDDTPSAATARVTGSPRVVVRTAGGRDFWDVPSSELAAVMEIEASKPFVDEQELYHRILGHYGVMRLTSKIYAELQRVHHHLSDATP